ncbi:MAG: PAS domain S-box protein, partial [Ginsengibacter sp.]
LIQIAEKDRTKVVEAFQNTMDHSSEGSLDVKFGMVNHFNKEEIIIHAKGRTSFNEQKTPYRINGTLEDVTEESLSRNAIEESERIIRNMVENSPVGICVINAKTRVCEIINERYLKISGKSIDEIIGKNYWECFSEYSSQYEASLNEVIEKGDPFYANEVEFKVYINGTEEEKYATFVFSPLKDKEGNVQKVAIWQIDNTPQVIARQKIKESENNLKLMILQAPVAIAIIRGPNYEVEIANKNALEVWGRKEQEVLNQPIFEVMPELIPQGIKEIIDEVLTTGKRFSTSEMPVDLLRGNSLSTVYLNFSYEPLSDQDGNINGIMTIGVDVSPQVIARQKIEESEQTIRTLVENAPFPIGVFTGREMIITIANQSIIDAWGKGNGVIGKSYKDILPEFESQEIFNILENVYLTGVPFHAFNQKIEIVKDGDTQIHYYNYSITPIFNSSGEVYGVMNTAAEVTELNEAKQKVEAALSEIKLFKYMADNAADPFILMREDGSFEYLNKMALKKWGYTREEADHLKVPDVDPIFNNKKFHQLFKRSQEESMPPFETLHKNKQGIIFPVEISLGNVQFEGRPLYFAIARDITDRKKAEKDIVDASKKAEESEKRFRDSVQQAPLGICILRGPEFLVEIANENYLLITDRKKDDFIGRPLFESMPEVRDDIERILNEIMKTGVPYYGNEFPVTVKRMGKVAQAYFNFVYHPLKESNGDISGIMAVAIEVTDTVNAKHLLEESEKHFRTMIMQSPVSMTILRGPDFIIESANKVLLDKIWRRPEEAILGKSILEVFPELKEQKFPELLHKVFTTGQTHSEKESLAYINGDDGVKKFYLDFEYAPLFESDSTVSGIMITVNDVTDKV